MDGWSAAQEAKKSNLAAYELAVTANLREVGGGKEIERVDISHYHLFYSCTVAADPHTRTLAWQIFILCACQVVPNGYV